ncbi:MAG: ATP-binding protein [Thermoguttaceae bacterium]|nr:ATP-binding protein [Thermoguttaceae bacterium]
MLEQVITGISPKPPRLFIYGTEGIGKSTFAASAPGAIFIQTEDGLGMIDCVKFPVATSYQMFEDQLNALMQEDHQYKNLVIDSADWLEIRTHKYLCEKYKCDGLEKVDGGYSKGYRYAAEIYFEVLQKLDWLRDNKEMGIVLLAHAKIEKYNDPEASGFDRFSPRLNKLTNDITKEWADAIFLATRRFGAAREESNGNERILRTVGQNNFVAKNRYNLPEEIPLDWRAYQTALYNSFTNRNRKGKGI